MHEDKFERQVSEKMDQLGFDPSDSVWVEVDREINQGKRKRRPFFWLFLFSGLLLAGGVLYIVKQKKFSADLTAATLGSAANKRPQNIPEGRTGKSQDSAQKTSPPAGKSDMGWKGAAGKEMGLVGSGEPLHFRNSGQGRKQESTLVALQPSHSLGGALPLNPDHQQVEKKLADQAGLTGKDSAALTSPMAAKAKPTLGTDAVSEVKTGIPKSQRTKATPWSLAYTASAGFSDVHQNALQPGNLTGNTYYPTYSNVAAPPPGTLGKPAEIHAGFSFSLGLQVNRQLSKRVYLSAGLGYRYFSTKINTGIQVDSPMIAYLYGGQAAAVNSFYRNGNGQEHTNQYQFIELPVNLDLQVNRNSRMPLIWQAGFSVAWMITSNALLFDPYNDIYFADKHSFQETQWNAATAILMGIPVQNHSLQVGPQLQYGLTGLLKTSANNPGHLYFVGLKMTYIP